MKYKGIDISSYQGTIIDFKKVKDSGVEVVYIKATEGVTFGSPSCSSRVENWILSLYES